MLEIKQPKYSSDSKTIKNATWSDRTYYAIILFVFAGSIAFAYIPRQHQLKVSIGASIAVGVLAKMGITFNTNVKNERNKLGDLIDTGEENANYILKLTKQEKNKIERREERYQNSSYTAKI